MLTSIRGLKFFKVEKEINGLGTIRAVKKLKNGIEMSILLDSNFSDLIDSKYEICFLKNGIPVDLPKVVKDRYKEHIIYKYFIGFVPESNLGWLEEKMSAL